MSEPRLAWFERAEGSRNKPPAIQYSAHRFDQFFAGGRLQHVPLSNLHRDARKRNVVVNRDEYNAE